MDSELRFRTKFNKIVELLLYLAHKRRGTDHYCASKYVYLADLEHFNAYGRPITFDEFGAMPWGPVALRTYELLKQEAQAMRRAGIDELPFDIEVIDNQILISNPKRAVNHDVFSESDLEVFDDVLEKYGHLPGIDLHNMTKEHFAYKNAWENRPAESRFNPMRYEDLLEESAEKTDKIDELKFFSHKM